MNAISPQSLKAIQHLARLIREGDLAEFLSSSDQAELSTVFRAHERDIRTISGLCRILTRSVDEADEQL